MPERPGLSAFVKNPKEAADSLIPLLQQAEASVLPQLRATAPVRVGATTGFRALSADTTEENSAPTPLASEHSGFRVSTLCYRHEAFFALQTFGFKTEKEVSFSYL